MMRPRFGACTGLGAVCGPHFWQGCPQHERGKARGSGQFGGIAAADVYSLAFPVIVIGVVAGLVYLALRPARVREALENGRLFKWLPAAGWVFVIWSLINAVFYIVDHTYVQTRYILVTAPGLMITILGILFAIFPEDVPPLVSGCIDACCRRQRAHRLAVHQE